LDDELWTLRCWPALEISRRIGLAPVTIRGWRRKYDVRAYRLGRAWYFNLDDCMELAKRVRRRDPETGIIIVHGRHTKQRARA